MRFTELAPQFLRCGLFSVDLESRQGESWSVPTPLFLKCKHRLAVRVRNLRIEQGLSQEDLALEAGIDRTYQSQIERAVGNPSLRVVCAIATALRVDVDDLLCE